MSHEDAYIELGALALGALSPEEEKRVLAHVSGCSICADELKRMRAVVSVMPENPTAGALSTERSGGIRGRLMKRAELSGPARASRPIATWVAAAAAVAFLFVSAAYIRASSERNNLRVAVARSDSLIARLTATALDREAQMAMMTGPGVRVMELAATGVHAPSARMFWDPATNRWAMFAHGMATPAKGRAYELWLVTKDRKIPAGVFSPLGDGSAVMHTAYAMSPGELKAIAITEEPEAGVTAPTGPIVLLGTAGT